MLSTNTTRPRPASGASPTGLGYCPGCYGQMRSKPPLVSSCLPDAPATRRWPGSFCSYFAESPTLATRSTYPAQPFLWTGSRAAASTGY